MEGHDEVDDAEYWCPRRSQARSGYKCNTNAACNPHCSSPAGLWVDMIFEGNGIVSLGECRAPAIYPAGEHAMLTVWDVDDYIRRVMEAMNEATD